MIIVRPKFRSSWIPHQLLFAVVATFAAFASLAQETAWVNQNGYQSIAVIDLTTNTVIQNIPAGLPLTMQGNAVNPDGTVVYFITREANPTQDSYMGAVDVATMTEIDLDGDPSNGITRIFLGGLPNDAAYFIQITPDGNFAYISNFRFGGNLYVVDLIANVKLANIPVGSRLYDLEITPDGSTIYVLDWGQGNLKVVDVATQSVSATIPPTGRLDAAEVLGIDLNSSATRAYIASTDRITAVDLATNSIVGTADTPNARFIEVVVSPDESLVYAATWNTGEVFVYDTTVPGLELSEVQRINVGTSSQHVAINGDGSRVLANVDWGLPSNGVAVIDTFTNSVITTIPVPGAFNGATVIIEIPMPTVYACVGFEPPLHAGPVRVKKNRALPLKAILTDESGNQVTDSELTDPPVIQVLFDPGSGPAVDVSDDAVPVGLGTVGNQFEYEDGKWRFNLKTKNYNAPGTYTVTMVSGDSYQIDPTCYATFIID